MFTSKIFSAILVVTFLALGAAVAFQVLEMNDYQLFEILQERFFPSK